MSRMLRPPLLVLAALAVLPAAWGALAVPLSIAATARLEPGASQTFTVTVPADALPGKPALSLLARLDSPGLGGSTFAMQITLNGKLLDVGRLLNKLPDTEMLDGLKLNWFGDKGWRVCYSPDYERANRDDHPACLVGGHAYDFVLDVSDLLVAGSNEIVIRHSETTIKSALVLQDLALVAAPSKVVAPEDQPEDPNAPLAVIAPTDRGKVPYQMQFVGNGGLRVSCGELTLNVNSRFSYPNAGWNVLGDQPDEQEWGVVHGSMSHLGETLQEAKGKSYRLARTLVRLPDHIAVSDKLTNLTDQDLHISVRYMLETSALTGGEVYLRGLKSRIMQGYQKGGDNPTVLVRQGEDGVGIVAEDDVLRAQCAQAATRQPAEAGLVDNLFMLEPHATYELRWAIYPVPGGDYFDFVNAIRRNWGTNFTIPGPFSFAPHPTHEGELPDVKGWLDNQSAQIVSLQIPMPRPAELAHGLAFLQEPEEQQRLKAQADKLRAQRPGLKVLQYLHVYITRLDAAVEAYKDARMLGPDGEQRAYPAGSWKPTFWLFLPTTTNAYGREMNKTFDLVLDQLGFDGVYWDELSHSAHEVTYGVSDGHSATPDLEHQTIKEKVATVALYCQAYQVQQAKRVLDAGKMLIGNGQPVTETMTKLHFPRFVEAWHPSNLRYAHLYCPLGLSSPDRVRSEADIVPSVRSHLLNGGLWYYYCGWNVVKLTHPTVTAHMYPFTPLELHAGYVIGRERILTAQSGLFGWGDKSRHTVYVYGPDGRQVTDFRAPVRTLKGATYSEVRLPPGSVAVIERTQ
jgi:hypothetical protein